MKAGIIGGGITGLTTALALKKLNISSVIYEQAAELNEIGAGIWLQPNALKVLDWLGIKQEIKQLGVELDKMEITDIQLKPFKKFKQEVVQDEEGNKTVAIHRARLQQLLYDEVQKTTEINLNKTYVRHTSDASTINIEFQEGGAESVDILLGADGIHSSVREQLFPKSPLRSTGQVCWRGVSKMNLPDTLNSLGREAWGKHVRFGFSRIYAGEVYWFAVADESHLEPAEERGSKEYLAELFQGFSPIVSELIAHTEAPAIHQTLLQDLKRINTWHHGRVCLIGDAAHATTPNMGQGAGQGIEDAYYISRLLSEAEVGTENAFEKFHLQRRKKVDYIVNTSWQFGKMAHSAIGQPLMKLMLKMTPERVMNSQMNKLYSIEN